MQNEPKPDVEALQAFANAIVEHHTGAIDGCDIEDLAIKHGLMCVMDVTEPCVEEGCPCAEFGFPTQCYRKTEVLTERLSVTDQRLTNSHARAGNPERADAVVDRQRVDHRGESGFDGAANSHALRELQTLRELLRRASKRREELSVQLTQWPCLQEQRHLDIDTPERAYWHHGYYMALDDLLRLLL